MPCFVESRNRILGDYWVFVVYGNVFKFSDNDGFVIFKKGIDG